MSRRPQKGLLDELQTDQEKELQNFQAGNLIVQIDDEESSDSEAEKLQNKALKQLPRFLLKNQINLDNAFQLDLPDEIHLALNPNFLKSSVYLQCLATLYGIRVDSTLRDSFKIKCGLLRIHGVNTFEDSELIEEQDKEKAVEKSKQLSKKKIAHYGLTTLDRGSLEIKQYETVQINPFFHQVSKRLDLQSLASMLTYRPLFSDDLEMIIDPEQLVRTEQAVPQHQSVKIEFQFQPPQAVDYDQYLSIDIMQEMQEEDGSMFNGFTRLKQTIVSDSKKFKIKITRQPQEKTEVKSSEHEQSQLDWNQFLDNTQFQEQEDLMAQEEEINHIQIPSEHNGEVHNNMEEEQFEIDAGEVQWEFVNTNFDENVAPIVRNDVEDFESDYKFHQQKIAQDQIEDQTSSSQDINEDQINKDLLKDSLKIKDLLESNRIYQPALYNQPYIPPVAKTNSKQTTTTFQFSDYMNYDRSIFQIRKQQPRIYPKEILIKCIEKCEIEFQLSRFFDFSLRQIFSQEPAEQNIQQINELDELIYQENVYFQDIHDNEVPTNHMIQEQHSDFEQPVQQEDHEQEQIEQPMIKQEIVIHSEVADPSQVAVASQDETEQVPLQEINTSMKIEPQIKMQEEIKTYQDVEPHKEVIYTISNNNKQPYCVSFKVILPEEQQNQIPVKLLKQCVYKIIHPILDSGKSVSFSRIWLTLKQILPQCYQLITVGQLYIAVLFLSSEEQLSLERTVTQETEFTISKRKQ